jgi:murein DD-endopeptidase MepM/ murein hydrolase activator NlpD
VVQRGDCLSKLCADALRAQGATPSQQDIHAAVRAVAKANHLANANRIYTGQKLDLSVLGTQSASATAPDSSQPWRTLVAGAASLSSEFGLRPDPFNGKVRQHEGIDLAAPSGTPVTALAAGQVIHSGWKRGYGNAVVLRHENGLESVYGHLSKSLVKVGEQVSPQVPIAKVGSQGHSTGAHLHFEVRRDGKALDPIAFLQNQVVQAPAAARSLAGFTRVAGLPSF